MKLSELAETQREETAVRVFTRFIGDKDPGQYRQRDFDRFFKYYDKAKKTSRARYLYYVNNILEQYGNRLQFPRGCKTTGGSLHIHDIDVPEIRRIMRSFNREPLKSWVTLAIYTGMRRGEIAELTRDKIDFENRVIILGSETKNGVPRAIPMTTVTKRVLEKWFTGEPHNRTFEEITGSGRDSISNSFARHMRALGVKLPFHGLRHFYGTFLVSRGTPIHEIKFLMGHANINTTLNYLYHQKRSRDKVIKSLEYLDEEE